MWYILVLFLHLTYVDASGLMLLYRPKDISNDCLISHHLRYDISFGHGMSDTITLVFRTLNEVDYKCLIEIVADPPEAFLLVVIRFPNSIATNCLMNKDAFAVIKKNKCLRVCELIEARDVNSAYFIITVKQSIRFRFLGNGSINYDMKANFYQVTATSARKKPAQGCEPKNETTCVTADDEFCFTSGVVCDGIKNCGVTDWYDERKSFCDEPVQSIGLAPVLAVVAVILCLMLAGGHLMLRWLPPLANSFFIFNANEDNRLCIDPVFIAPDFTPCEVETPQRVSIIPVSSSSSESNPSDGNEHSNESSQEIQTVEAAEDLGDSSKEREQSVPSEVKPSPRRKNTMRMMTDLFQQYVWSVAGPPRTNKGKGTDSKPL